MNTVTNTNNRQLKTKSIKSPTVLSFCSDIGTPVAVFEKLSRNEPNAFLFESTEGDSRLARYSFLGIDPCQTISFSNGRVMTRGRDGQTKEETISDPIDYLQRTLETFQEELIGEGRRIAPDGSIHESDSTNINHVASFLPFIGGLVGYLGYGSTQYLEKISQQSKDVVAVPDGFYGMYDSCVAFDHQYRRVTVMSFRGEEHAHSLVKRISDPSGLNPLRITQQVLSEEEIFDETKSSVSKEDFIKAVEKAKQFIQEGQVFQIVLSQRFSAYTTVNPIDLYRMLTATNPSPYAYYLKCPDFVYLGSSPETFVQCRDGQLLLRALAGTRRRGATTQEDETLACELKADEKEMAEHRMLVDLGRNDLGRVCRPGSIKVGEIASLTKYTHVMHLATEITGTLDGTHTSFDAFRSCFPAGTVSGAPKVRAMQLLSSLEPERRGVYSGSVGYFDLNGNTDGAIAIRSVLIKDGIAHVNAGAGLVYDSKPEMEYQETRNKAKSVLQAIKLAERSGK
jgi:anthranilate synthase component 1